MKKRVTAPKPRKKTLNNNFKDPPGSDSGHRPIQPVMQSVLQNSETTEVEPSACLPLHLYRNRSNNAVKKLKASFTGKLTSNNASLPGIVAGTSTSIVVPLIDDLEHLIFDSLIKQGYSKENSELIRSKHERWFGIIDGNQFHAAIMELRDENPTIWGSYQWPVTIVRQGKTLNDYRKLARIQNERNKTIYHFESTIFDLLNGLRLEYNILYDAAFKSSRTGKRGVKINHRQVAERYDGGDHSNNTYIKQAVTVASRLAPDTIQEIGDVCNMECPDIILKNVSLNKKDLKTTEEIIDHNDCRLFRSFICFGALRSAKAFMNAVLDEQEDVQVNCIYRLKHWCESNDFKPVQSKVVGEQFNFSILSLKEEQKFLSLIGYEEWPSHMQTIKENLLRTTLCDQELAMNAGNGTDILPSIWKGFKRLHPGEAKGIEEQNTEQTDSTEELTGSNEPSEPPTIPDAEIDKQLEEEEERRKEEEKREKERLRKEKLRKTGDECLSDNNILTKRISFDEYITEFWTSSSSRVDLVLSAIRENESDDRLRRLPSFCKRVLKTGCYAFFIVNNSQYILLEKAFQEEGLKVMEYCFIIVYDTSTMQKRVTNDFPLRHGDIAILAKMPGIHPNGYTPVFSDKEGETMPDDFVKYASLINISCCQDKLRRPNELAALRTDERSVQLYSHVIKMLSPVQGSVIDPLGGTGTSTISCLETNRSCVCLENDIECYRFAVGRARIFATPGATMQDLDDYAEPIDVDALYDGSTSPPRKKRKTVINNSVSVLTVKDKGEDIGSSEGEAEGVEALMMMNSS